MSRKIGKNLKTTFTKLEKLITLIPTIGTIPPLLFWRYNMIFGTNTTKLEMSDGFKVMESGIGDMGIIFQILSGLYNDPQRIIVQEYIANARDAHREIGHGDIAVDVTLPTYLESELKIRDYGPGISPDRMANVFINYGTSTKREDNIQTGAFGIGAKSVFCYTDSCTIETWVKGIYYVYSYLKSEDNKPKCVLMSNSESNEPSGTRISINIKYSDINVIASNVYFVTQYWTVRPNILNEQVYRGQKYNEYEVTAEGDNWRYLSNRNSKCHVIIDQIPYKFDFDSVYKEGADRSKYDAIIRSGNFDFILNTGDVTMSPNREGPVYDIKSIKVLKKIVEDAYDKIKNNIIEEFNQVDNIFDAFELYEKYNHLRKVIGDINWRKLTLTSRYIRLNTKFYKMYRGGRGGRRKNNSTKPSCEGVWELPIDRSSLYVFNDDVNDAGESIISPARLKTILQSHNSFNVIEPITYDPKYHTEYVTEEMYNEAFDEYNKEINIDSFNCKLITSFEKYKAPRSERSEKTNIYKYVGGNENHPTTNWDRMNVDFEDLEGYFVEYERGTPVGYTIKDIRKLKAMFKIQIYGIPTRYLKVANKVDTLTSLNDMLSTQYEMLEEYITSNNDVIYSRQILGHTENNHYTFRRLKDSTKNLLINCPESLAYFNASDEVRQLANTPIDNETINKFELIKRLLKSSTDIKIKPTYNLEEMGNTILKKYPLLHVYDQYGIDDNMVTHVNHYLEYMIKYIPKISQTQPNILA